MHWSKKQEDLLSQQENVLKVTICPWWHRETALPGTVTPCKDVWEDAIQMESTVTRLSGGVLKTGGLYQVVPVTLTCVMPAYNRMCSVLYIINSILGKF